MKTFVIFALLLVSSLTISESYAYLETAIKTCETLYNRPNAPVPSYDPEKYQKCVEKAEREQWSIDNSGWIMGGIILAIIVIVFVFSAVRPHSHVRITQEQTSDVGGALPKGYSQTSSGELTEGDLQNNFSRFSWEQMEHLVGRLFEKKGYSTNVTKPTGDFGIDVEARNSTEFIGIQVKHWNNDVGFDDVAKTLGVSQKYNKSIIISTKSGFSNQAWEHQKNNQYILELWDTNKFKSELRTHMLRS